MTDIKEFVIYAHYRKDVMPETYIIMGSSASNAKKIFEKTYPWLTVFKVEKFEEGE